MTEQKAAKKNKVDAAPDRMNPSTKRGLVVTQDVVAAARQVQEARDAADAEKAKKKLANEMQRVQRREAAEVAYDDFCALAPMMWFCDSWLRLSGASGLLGAKAIGLAVKHAGGEPNQKVGDNIKWLARKWAQEIGLSDRQIAAFAIARATGAKERLLSHRTTYNASLANVRDARPHSSNTGGATCICGIAYTRGDSMVCCDTCQGWFHLACVKLSAETATDLDEYTCPNCEHAAAEKAGNVLPAAARAAPNPQRKRKAPAAASVASTRTLRSQKRPAEKRSF